MVGLGPADFRVSHGHSPVGVAMTRIHHMTPHGVVSHCAARAARKYGLGRRAARALARYGRHLLRARVSLGAVVSQQYRRARAMRETKDWGHGPRGE